MLGRDVLVPRRVVDIQDGDFPWPCLGEGSCWLALGADDSCM